ncbi:hypothetical protein [Bradyrhizobium sp.]|uniref:hypothetical protein n=1 Tax=Bradyrhizobium sp. TaxID=376 RepID=UPI004037AA4C
MLRYVVFTAIALTVIFTSTAASAGPCASRPDFVAFLKDNFGELETGYGLSNRGHLVEMFVSPDGSWSILLSQPDGRSCLVDAGEAWIVMSPAGPSRKAGEIAPLSHPGRPR